MKLTTMVLPTKKLKKTNGKNKKKTFDNKPKSKSTNSPNPLPKNSPSPNKKSSKTWSMTSKPTPAAANLSFAKNSSKPTTTCNWLSTWFTPFNKVLLTWWTCLTKSNKKSHQLLTTKTHPNKAKTKTRKVSPKSIHPTTRSNSKLINWSMKCMTSPKFKSVGLSLSNCLMKSLRSLKKIRNKREEVLLRSITLLKHAWQPKMQFWSDSRMCFSRLKLRLSSTKTILCISSSKTLSMKTLNDKCNRRSSIRKNFPL